MRFGAFLPTSWDDYGVSPLHVAIEHYQRVGLDYALVGFESEDLDDQLRQMRIFAEQVGRRFVAAGEPPSRTSLERERPRAGLPQRAVLAPHVGAGLGPVAGRFRNCR